ncbi:flagellar motor switch phosphatase FliY [Chengkuizengella axinellae]|uniref:Flagellar motor switch phosphatase FliY n=1 Tax=Chengkuizengella axinellae TaxID=3064388 RepID=A0ABT9IXC7_9BACL|nr:flagellar motor switch phosphatase FliY [Chengkuizengella sp. 2205SS18-9]MDP5273450.1 flagellar motor switch phosphatase FliY [Chengkuizengella sp. 2205SS18-9]
MNNKNLLTQEEIDALLKEPKVQSDSLDIHEYLSTLEIDALGEIGNITFGSAATALSTLIGKKVDITTPHVSIALKEELKKQFVHPHLAVHVEYIAGLEGINLLVIAEDDSKIIADLMLGGDGTNVAEKITDIHISAVQEAMNQMMGSSATSMSSIFNRIVNISPPSINIIDSKNQAELPSDQIVIKVSFRLKIADLIDSTIMQLVTIPFAKNLVDSLVGGDVEQTTEQELHQSEIIQPDSPINVSHHVEQPEKQQDVGRRQQETNQNYEKPMNLGKQNPIQSNVNVQNVQYETFSNPSAVHSDQVNLNLLLDIPLNVTVELGRTKKKVKDILDLTQGSIIELDKLAGEPVDMLVNDKHIAKGEVVVIDENFGVRVTEIISQVDRLNKIQ